MGGELNENLGWLDEIEPDIIHLHIGDVKPEAEKKRRGRRKKSEIEAEQKEN